ncbi:hypothetical protein GBL98_20040 [Yersinia pseudotuberculosis]|nr:hypothetical protein [Yersinia pseudotuberculosis]MBO1612965.1 hypothetical protein [Yersinia pseudotuberculosis]MBO1623369.1 hypothetical protein [Yersinia pseudotuberculosis]
MYVGYVISPVFSSTAKEHCRKNLALYNMLYKFCVAVTGISGISLDVDFYNTFVFKGFLGFIEHLEKC